MNNQTTDAKILEGSACLSPALSPPKGTTRNTGQTARRSVCSTSKLVSNIILRLSFTEIITTTAVCHLWRNMVAANPNLQKVLFLGPEKIRRVLVCRMLRSPWIELALF
jgi:hypothetical protein